jgi:hypothetical protein
MTDWQAWQRSWDRQQELRGISLAVGPLRKLRGRIRGGIGLSDQGVTPSGPIPARQGGNQNAPVLRQFLEPAQWNGSDAWQTVTDRKPQSSEYARENPSKSTIKEGVIVPRTVLHRTRLGRSVQVLTRYRDRSGKRALPGSRLRRMAARGAGTGNLRRHRRRGSRDRQGSMCLRRPDRPGRAGPFRTRAHGHRRARDREGRRRNHRSAVPDTARPVHPRAWAIAQCPNCNYRIRN